MKTSFKIALFVFIFFMGLSSVAGEEKIQKLTDKRVIKALLTTLKRADLSPESGTYTLLYNPSDSTDILLLRGTEVGRIKRSDTNTLIIPTSSETINEETTVVEETAVTEKDIEDIGDNSFFSKENLLNLLSWESGVETEVTFIHDNIREKDRAQGIPSEEVNESISTWKYEINSNFNVSRLFDQDFLWAGARITFNVPTSPLLDDIDFNSVIYGQLIQYGVHVSTYGFKYEFAYAPAIVPEYAWLDPKLDSLLTIPQHTGEIVKNLNKEGKLSKLKNAYSNFYAKFGWLQMKLHLNPKVYRSPIFEVGLNDMSFGKFGSWGFMLILAKETAATSFSTTLPVIPLKRLQEKENFPLNITIKPLKLKFQYGGPQRRWNVHSGVSILVAGKNKDTNQ